MTDLSAYVVRAYAPRNPFNRPGRFSPGTSVAIIAAGSAFSWVLIIAAFTAWF